MDIKQFEYFLAVCERGSINKAAECLYTTQPNVSRVINNLENELGRELFKRSSKGVILTPYGNTIRQYAEVVLKHIKLITDISLPSAKNKFSLSSYRSDIISKILTRFYEVHRDKVLIEHYQGSVDEITDNVKKGLSELGIVYIAKPQMKLFSHILSHKNLEFTLLNLLMASELCMLGINLAGKKYEDYDIKALSIENSNSFLSIGYVYAKGQELSDNARWFIDEFIQTL